uniref:BHLH domain-containing protein n=1 Tax=Bos indicus x Bos taurus TaxID=30522 RepID=A0A4W2GF78_BOBOX
PEGGEDQEPSAGRRSHRVAPLGRPAPGLGSRLCAAAQSAAMARLRGTSEPPPRAEISPAFIQKRNERERQRVRCVNEGYARLRGHLPGALAEKRLSKVETLRAAIRYIKHLQELLSAAPDGAAPREPRAAPSLVPDSAEPSCGSSSPFFESEECSH